MNVGPKHFTLVAALGTIYKAGTMAWLTHQAVMADYGLVEWLTSLPFAIAATGLVVAMVLTTVGALVSLIHREDE